MQIFAYRAHRADGSEESGSMRAASTKDVARRLTRDGSRPFQIRLLDTPQARIGSATSWRLVNARPIDLARLFLDISLLLDAGFTIDGALSAVVAGEANKERKQKLQSALDIITAGHPAAEGFATLADIPPDAIALIKAGERSGKLGVICRKLAENFAARAKRRSALWEALSYPVFLLFVMIAALVILALVLVPALEPIFDSPGTSRPFTLEALSLLNGILLDQPFLPPLTLLSFLGLWMIASRSTKLRDQAMKAVLHTPGIGPLIKDAVGARYLDMLGLLLSSGVSMIEALKLATGSTTNRIFHARLSGIEERVATGARLDGALAEAAMFGKATTSLVTIGEDANALPAVLERASQMVQASVDRRIATALRLLTPALTITMGLAVGSLVVSVMTTIMSINDVALQ